jgi:hypothetical protein
VIGKYCFSIQKGWSCHAGGGRRGFAAPDLMLCVCVPLEIRGIKDIEESRALINRCSS